MPVPAAWGTCCSSHRPKPPPAASPTGSPDSWTRLYPGTPRYAQIEPSLHSHPPLSSLPWPLCNQIPKFRSSPGPNRRSLPPPTGCGRPGPGPAVRPRPGWGILCLGASCLWPAESNTTPPDFSTVRPHRATQSAATLPATPRARVMELFFLPLNHELGSKPQGGEIWDKKKKIE